MTTQEPRRPLAQRLLWFVALWVAGVGMLAVVAFILRLLLKSG